MEISIKMLIASIAIIMMIQVCLGVYISMKYKKKLRKTNRQETYMESVQQGWYDFFFGEHREVPDVLIPTNKEEIQVVEYIFLTYLNKFSNEGIREKVQHFANAYLHAHYAKQLKSVKWSIRMNALFRIFDFHIDRLKDECVKLENKKLSTEEWFQLFKIYAIFDVSGFLSKLANYPNSFSEHEYRKLINNVPLDSFVILFTHFKELPRACQLSIIDIVGLKRHSDHVPFLEEQIQSEDSEIRIRSLKAVYEIGWMIDLETYKPFVQSPIWEERLMVSKLFSRLPIEQTYPYMKKLLEDESWWVRSETAHSIARVKNGEDKLLEFLQTSNDSYALEMVQEILQKGYE
ncbi:HEAT repeat domain-containing protein [Pontibacillus litoralis]|nr:HEAT repeat domain-containing protein [Pontibacillus litoralis]